MELINFSIAKDNIALETGVEYFDLHNNFSFQNLSYNPMGRTLDLTWCRRSENWVKPTDPKQIALLLQGVQLFKASQRDSEIPYTEDDCIDFIGFVWNDSIEEMDGYASNEPAENCTHLIVGFMSGFSLKVSAEAARIEFG